MMHQSIATIDSPEFINLQPLEINPLMSSCEIKVLYLGENRNHSYITKEVATDMAKTLRGAPIVGYYREDKGDFRDHGEKIIFDDEGVKFESMTRPYGFVSPEAKVWFQKFEEQDDFGNSVTREYLMTTGYLWTGQYEEAQLAVTEGRPQSMELDEETLDGHWSTNQKTGMEFFIINDAIFSKLCILGEDVEPCFEGARVTAPEVSTSFTKMDDNFKRTLYTMMQDLKFALEGGKNMEIVVENTEEIVTEETVVENTEAAVEAEVVAEELPATEFDSLKRDEAPKAEEVKEEEASEPAIEEIVEEAEPVVEPETEVEETPAVEEEVIEENLTEDDNSEQSITTETQDSIEATQSSQENFAKSEEDEEEKDEDESKEEETDSKDEEDEEEDEKKKDYSLLEKELEDTKTAYAELEAKYNALVEFKNAVDNDKKDQLINSFYMLSDEDKKDVIENKSNYSLDEIEAKLSVICVRKKVNFDLDDTSKNDNIVEDEVTTYNLSETEVTSIPAWIAAVKHTRDNK